MVCGFCTGRVTQDRGGGDRRAHGARGAAAAPLAKEVIETYMKLTPGTNGHLGSSQHGRTRAFLKRLMINRLTEHRELDSFDIRYVALIFAILGIGVLSIYSVTYGQRGVGTPYYLKQLIWIGVGAAAFLIMWASDYHHLARFAYPAYAAILVMLVVVLFEGERARVLNDGSPWVR